MPPIPRLSRLLPGLRAFSLRRPLSTTAPLEPLVTTTLHAELGVVTVTLNSPKTLNALTVPMAAAFDAALSALDHRVVRAVVLTGAGRAFSAGGDLAFLRERQADTPYNNGVAMRRFYAGYLERLRAVPVPIVAAVHGPAIGAGLCLALGADVRVAAASTQLGVTFVGIGLHPGMGATHFLPQLVGPQVAARMCLTGDTLTGAEAARVGLVAEALDSPEEVLPRALALAARMAAQAPVAVRTCLRTLRAAQDVGLDRALLREADAQAQCYGGADMGEGIAAVAAKRKPVWVKLIAQAPKA